MRRLLVIGVAGVLVACGGADEPSAGALAADASGAESASETDELPQLTGDDVWIVDVENSSVTFEGVQEGALFDGRFNRFDAAIRLNPDDPAGAEIHAVIDMASVDAGDTDRNDALPTREWFHTKSFPVARFTSTEVRRAADGNYEAVGSLSMKGATRPVVLPFTLEVTGDTARAVGTIALDRTDYSVGEGEFADGKFVDAAVDVTVDVSATRN